jgi:uncharacterized protein YraI
MRLAAILVLLSAASAAAEPATVTATVNLRSGAGTGHEIVGKIPGGSRVDVSNCGEWCEVEWQGRKGFAVAASLDRGGRVPSRRASARRDIYAVDVTPKSDVPMSAGTYEAPERRYGPYFWSYGPPSGPYKGTSGIGYRGRW